MACLRLEQVREKAEQNLQKKEYVDYLTQNTEKILNDIQRKLPVKSTESITFNRMEYQGDSITFHCSDTHNFEDREWQHMIASSGVGEDIQPLLHEAFGYHVNDIILILYYSIKLVISYKNRRNQDVSISPTLFADGYYHYYRTKDDGYSGTFVGEAKGKVFPAGNQ